jgi:hypothetical protein
MALKRGGFEMSAMRLTGFGVATAAALVVLNASGANAEPASRAARATGSDISAQAREPQRARTRIRVRPLRRAAPEPLHRECVPVFTERWIPQWGGRVLYAGQQCWWAGG